MLAAATIAAAALLLCSQDTVKDILVRWKIRHKVIMLTTDNPTVMVKMRKLVVQSPGFQHIMETRWGIVLRAAV